MTTAAEPRIVARPLRLSVGQHALLLRVGTGIVLLLIWEVLVRWLAPAYVAKPSGVIKAIPRVVVRDESTPLTALAGGFWPSVEKTVVAVLIGLVIGVFFGVLVGLTMGRLRDADAALKIYVNAFFALPTIAVLPLMTLWFGYSATARLAIIIFGAFMPVCLNVYDGVRRLPTEFIEVSKTYHARWWNVWFGIALPASLPYLLAGLRLAFGRALVGAVVAEYLLALHPGLGFWILTTSRAFDQNGSMVGVLVLMIVAVSMNAVIDVVTPRLLPWYRRTG
jgi:ABC-type nitrate/sulfonate/bicarbonate transport system permease component